MSMKTYMGRPPQLLPEEYLSGKLEGWGVIAGPMGGLQSRYTIGAEGHYQRGLLLFTETWTFDDGKKQTLNREIKKIADHQYEGTETKLVGQARGEQAGFVFHWEYTRDVPGERGDTRLNFDDWFYRIDERVCIVRGTAGRAGLPFATAHVTYRKV